MSFPDESSAEDEVHICPTAASHQLALSTVFRIVMIQHSLKGQINLLDVHKLTPTRFATCTSSADSGAEHEDFLKEKMVSRLR